MSWVATAVMVAVALGGAAHTQHVANKQDDQAAAGITRQATKQKEGDARIAAEVERAKGSTSSDERRDSLNSYMDTLRLNKGGLTAGLDQNIGSEAFRESANDAAGGVQDYTAKTANLMSRIDAPMMQRRNESFGYGHLGTDLNMLNRESRGMAFLDEMRLRGIGRNPWVDAGLSVAGGAAGSYGGGKTGAGTGASGSGKAIRTKGGGG